MVTFITNLFKSRAKRGRYVGSRRTHDATFTFRMGAGALGEITRHDFDTEACLPSVTTPPTAYGQFVLPDGAGGVRPIAAGDEGTTYAYGVTARPYPYQQNTGGMSAAFNSAVPPTNQAIDVLRRGYILVQLSGTVQPIKGGSVFIWATASTGNHIQGGVETAASSGNTIALDTKTTFQGGADSNGVCEIGFNI